MKADPLNCAWCGEEILTEAGVFVHAGDRSRFRFEGNPPHVAGDRRQPVDGAEAPKEDMMDGKQLASAIAEGLNTGTNLEATKREKAPKMRKGKPGTVALAKATMKNREARLKKREPKEKVELRTLALRVTNAEFDLVHKAAGPRNLSQFMKSTVLAAAQKHLSK